MTVKEGQKNSAYQCVFWQSGREILKRNQNTLFVSD